MSRKLGKRGREDQLYARKSAKEEKGRLTVGVLREWEAGGRRQEKDLRPGSSEVGCRSENPGEMEARNRGKISWECKRKPLG